MLKRETHIDLLKIVCSFAVILIHVSSIYHKQLEQL